MVRFIHAADVHLDSPLKGLAWRNQELAERIQSATRSAFVRLIDDAIEQEVDLVLLAGDLYDGDWDDYQTGLFFGRQARRLEEAGIPLLVVAGNHDAQNKMTKQLQLPDNVRVFSAQRPETVELEQFGVAVHGQSYATQAVRENLASRFPKAVAGWVNIGILHTSLDGRPGHEPYAPCRLDDLLEKQYDYWALGHVHAVEQVHQDPPVWFSGNLQGRHVRELGPKGYLLVELAAGRSPRVEFRAVDIARWQRCELHVDGDIGDDDFFERLQQEVAQLSKEAEGRVLVVRLEVVGTGRLIGQMLSDPEHWTNNITAVLEGLSPDICLEKLVPRVRSEQNVVAEDTAIAELEEFLRGLAENPRDTCSLKQELETLLSKLPQELKEQNAALCLDDSEAFKRLVEEAAELLLHKLHQS